MNPSSANPPSTRALATIVALTVAAATPAAAQAPPRVSEDVVVTGTIVPLSAESLSRTVTVVPRADLEQLGLRSVTEALRLVPGVDARARGPLEVQTDFSIRGATFGQILVLVDGLRLNNSQSGHHNGEIPLPAVAVDRVEVVAGAASAAHGADALGGTINVLTRRDRHRTVSLLAGQHGYVDVQASMSADPLAEGWVLSGWASRSSGFTFDRDHARGGAALRGHLADAWTVDVRHQRRAFGANGFYGPSPSKEWTDQTMASVGWRSSDGPWTTTAQALFRNHHDHFRWDINRPGFAENRHRTDAADIRLVTSRVVDGGGTLAVGLDGGGDWIRSSNLGDHRYSRGSVFAEWLQTIDDRTTVQAGVRLDTYSNFGTATSPSVALVTAMTPNVRVRASAGRAFRIPTFTELYYSDPNNLGRDDLSAERGWSVDGGVDGDFGLGWTGSFSVFRRWDEDVIDWVRLSPGERFRSTNIHDVTSTGLEASVTRRWAAAMVRAYYARLDVDAPALTVLSRYLLEYAPHQVGGSVTVPLGTGLRTAVNVDHRRRLDGQVYSLVGARVSWRWQRMDVFAAATNLLDETYEEVAGVEMPGRWVTVGLSLR